MQTLRSLTLMMFAGACLVLAACHESSTSSTGDGSDSPFGPRTSPEQLLYNLEAAYDEQNATEYDSLLAEDFAFVLTEEDQEQPGMLDSWGRQIEMDVHAHLFDPDLVDQLELSFDIGERLWDESSSPPMWSIVISNVKLRLSGRDPHDLVMLDLRVDNASAQFWFRENPWTAEGSSRHVWSIARWEDLGSAWHRTASASPASAPETWGSIKLFYR